VRTWRSRTPAPGVSIVTGKADAGQRSTAMSRLIGIISLNPFAMRSFLLLLPALFSVPLFSQTTFAPIGAQWTYTQHHVGAADTNLFVIQCVGDTVIQGRTCSQLEYTAGWNDCMPFYHEVALQGDSILAWQRYESRFMTLYVLNQAPGFTWKSLIDYPFGVDTMRWTVLDTGHVAINGVTLFSQTVSATASGPYGTTSLSSGTITERLGDMAYLFPWIGGACDMEVNTPLRCYQEGTLIPPPPLPPPVYWLNPQFPQCDLSTGINENIQHAGMHITPNLVERGGQVSVTFDPPIAAGGGNVVVRDISGRMMSKLSITGASMSIAFEAPGIMLLTAEMHDGTRITRCVVVR